MGGYFTLLNSKTVVSTLTASGWNGSSAPYNQTISIPEITSNIYAVEIVPDSEATSLEQIAYMNSAFCGGELVEGSLTVQAFGKKPEIDIPIVIIIRGEI